MYLIKGNYVSLAKSIVKKKKKNRVVYKYVIVEKESGS